MGEFDGRIFISGTSEIYAMVPVAIEKQVKLEFPFAFRLTEKGVKQLLDIDFMFQFKVQALLDDKRTSEALDLARNARKTGLTKDDFMKVVILLACFKSLNITWVWM